MQLAVGFDIAKGKFAADDPRPGQIKAWPGELRSVAAYREIQRNMQMSGVIFSQPNVPQ
jgi:hypothetical protein